MSDDMRQVRRSVVQLGKISQVVSGTRASIDPESGRDPAGISGFALAEARLRIGNDNGHTGFSAARPITERHNRQQVP